MVPALTVIPSALAAPTEVSVRLELRQVRRTFWVLDGERAVEDTSASMLVPCADLGLAFDARLGGPLGLRLSVLDRM